MDNTIGKIPEFTSDETPVSEQIQEEVKPTDEVEETETPAPPAEKPDDQVVVEESPAPSQEEVQRAEQGLQTELVKLRKEIAELRGQKREIKQEQINKVQAQIDELKDLHPDDVATIDRVLRAKGYMTKQESEQMFYEAVKTEELNKFLERYPEYKPENDPGDVNWQTLQKELSYYRTPDNPRLVADILEKAHRSVVKVPSGNSASPAKRQVQLASVGGGGKQSSAPSTKLAPEHRSMLKGFTDEEIQLMEKKLS